MYIPSAARAHEVALDYRNQLELEKIGEAIRNSIIRGNMQVTITGQLSHENRKELEDLGYKIHTYFGDNEFTINWDR